MAKKRVVLYVLLVLLIFALSHIVYAVGISPPSYNANLIYGKSQEFQFYAVNTMDCPMDVEIGAGSEYLSDYIELSDKKLSLGPKEWKPFTIKINYPDDMVNPGIHTVRITIGELRKEQGMMVARAAIIGKINLREAFPGKYAEIQVKAENKNINETVPIQVILYNYGTEAINKAEGFVDIYFNNEKIKRLELSSIENISTFESQSLWAHFDTTGFKPGRYTVNATVNYDENIAKASGEFKIGTLHIDIIDFTKQAYKDKINPFEITIESNWNEKISNIYADVNVLENNSVVARFKTINEDLEKWEQKTITGYLDTSKLSLGEHDMQIYLNYEALQTIAQGKINITEEIKPEIKKPMKLSLFPTMFIVILIIIIILLIISRRKKNEKETLSPET